MRTMHTIMNTERGGVLWKISESVSKDFPSIDPQDVFSSLYERLYTLERASLDVRDPGVQAWLREEAQRIAWTIRTEQLRLTSQYEYRVSDVARIMETVFCREDWPSGFTPADARNEWDHLAPLEVRMDVCAAFLALDEELREVLIARYYDQQVPEAGTREAGRLRHSLNVLTNFMNSWKKASGGL